MASTCLPAPHHTTPYMTGSLCKLIFTWLGASFNLMDLPTSKSPGRYNPTVCHTL